MIQLNAIFLIIFINDCVTQIINDIFSVLQVFQSYIDKCSSKSHAVTNGNCAVYIGHCFFCDFLFLKTMYRVLPVISSNKNCRKTVYKVKRRVQI